MTMTKINNYLELIMSMQIYNYYTEYDKAKEIYNKYNFLIPRSNIYLQNKALNEYEIATKQFILKSKPRNLYIELFDKCQLNCIMCNQHKMNYFLPEKYIKEIAFDYLPYLDTILWQGGEVFLWDYFIDTIKLISNYKQITQSIITNCQNLNLGKIKQLTSIDNIKLIISIDAAKKSTYEKIRQGSSFKKLINNINLLNKYKLKYKSNITFHINFVILKENYMEIPNIIDFAKKYKFVSISFNKCLNPIDYNNNLSLETQKKIDNILTFALIKSVNNNIKIAIHHPSKLLMSLQNHITNNNMICKNPWYKLFIGSGYTFSSDCICLKRENYYNTDTIKNIWNSKLMQTYRKHILEIKQSNNICNSNCRLYGHYAYV